MNRFPQRLKELRKINKMTQVQLAKKLDFGYTAIANYESGRNEPAIDILTKLAEIFRVSVDYLIGHADDYVEESHMHPEEKELIEQYRSLDIEEREVLRSLVNVMVMKKK